MYNSNLPCDLQELMLGTLNLNESQIKLWVKGLHSLDQVQQ